MQSSTTPDPGYQWESDKLTEDTTNESQEVSPFPAGDHKAHINRRAQNIANTRQNKNIKDPQKKYRLGTVSKIFYWRAFFNRLNYNFTRWMTIIFEMAIKKCVKFFRLFHFTKVLTKPSLEGSASLSNILHSTVSFSSRYNINQIR